MKTNLEISIETEAKHIAATYRISELNAKIFLLKGITLYQDNLLWGEKNDFK